MCRMVGKVPKDTERCTQVGSVDSPKGKWIMVATMNETSGKWEVTINGQVSQFDTEQQAGEAIANAENRRAAVEWAKAFEGGTKYRDEAFGLAILKYCVNTAVKADKVKAKDLTAETIFGYVENIDDDDFEQAISAARKLRNAFGTLTGKHQSPMKGGILPRHVAESAAILVKAESGAAQQSVAGSRILSVL